MTAEAPARQSFFDRALDASPIVGVWLALSMLYVWQASRHGTPWLFSDEIEYTEIARAISETGTPARRGVEYWGAGLYPWLTAPFWWIHSVSAAYTAIKDAQSIVMAAAVFPTYALARTMLDRPWSLLAAFGAGATPAFVFAPMLIQEPIAYPYSALALLAIARALATRSRGWIVAAVCLAVVGPQVRDQLILLPLIAAVSSVIVAVRSTRARTALARLGTGRVIGLSTLIVLAAIALSELYAARSTEWRVARADPLGMLDQAADAGAALAVGLGVLPLLAGLTLAFDPRSLPRTRAFSAFHAVLLTSLGLFLLYAGGKGVYGAQVFEPRIVERNLVYLAPLLFVAAAVAIRFAAVRTVALVAATAVTAAILLGTIFPITTPLYGDAPSLAALTRLHSDYGWTQEGLQAFLLVALVFSALALLAPRIRARAGIAVGAAALVLCAGWSLRTETIGSRASNDISSAFLGGLPKPLDWADQTTGGSPTIYIGQKIADPNSVWSLEFWNRSVKRIWSTDGTAPGPGPTLTPDLTAPDGTLADDSGFHWAISDFGVDLVGKKRLTMGTLTLVEHDGPLRLEQSLRGVFNDGWVGSSQPADSVSAEYSRFSTPGERAGTVDVRVARTGWCPSDPKADVPGRVEIDVGTLKLGEQKNGVLDSLTERRGWIVAGCADRTFTIPTPRPPFHVKVTITPPFQPNALDPSNPERRYFGAQVGFGFRSTTAAR